MPHHPVHEHEAIHLLEFADNSRWNTALDMVFTLWTK